MTTTEPFITGDVRTPSRRFEEVTRHHRRRGRLLAGVGAIAALAAGVAVATQSQSNDSRGPVEPRASGVYALTAEQWAYYAGVQAGRGTPIDVDASFVLSDTEIAYLSARRPPTQSTSPDHPTSADAAESWLTG
jgi:hypothetical protein